MTIASAEAINAAGTSLMTLFDDHLPSWDDEARRRAFIAATWEVFEHLERALYEATTAKSLGCVARPLTSWHKGVEARRPNEDGTNPTSPSHD